MRILLVHNYYGSSAPSGENQVFEAERAMLERHGVKVDVFTRHSDEIRVSDFKTKMECVDGEVAHLRSLAVKPFETLSDQERLFVRQAIEMTHEVNVRLPTDERMQRLVRGYWDGDAKIIREIIEWGRSVVPERIANRYIGEIQTHKNSIRSILFHTRFRGPLKILVLEELEEILANAVLYNKGRDGDETFYNLAHRLILDPGNGEPRKEFIARLIVKETADGNRTWTVEFSNKKELTEVPTTGEAATVEVTHLKPPSTHTILKWIYGVNGDGFQASGFKFQVERFRLKVLKLWGLVRGAACTVANPFAARALRQKIREFKPDVVHFHNTFPLISPLAVRAAKKSGAKVVMTLHNYRMVCAAGIPMRCGKVCRACFSCAVNPSISPSIDRLTDCQIDRLSSSYQSVNPSINQSVNPSILPALRHRCYRGSLLATVPLAINIWLYRKWWARWVDRFIVLSEFQKKVMVECGLPEEKIVVKGNFVGGAEYGPRSSFCKSGEDTASPLSSQRSGVVFVGRLSDEKGVKTLLKAWRMLNQESRLSIDRLTDCQIDRLSSSHQSVNPSIGQSVNPPILTLLGDGDQRAEYESLAKGLNVRFLGKVSHDRVLEELARAKLLVMPSECWETFGLAVVEAAMCGTPAVVSDLGALPGIVKKLGVGRVVKAGDVEALAKGIGEELEGDGFGFQVSGFGFQVSGFKFQVEEFGEERNFEELMRVYGEGEIG